MRAVASILAGSGVESAKAEAYELVRGITGLGRADLVWTRGALARTDEARVLALARRRAEGVPLQYLTGTAGFRHLELKVGPGVLVPRPETEVVVDRALVHLPVDGMCVDVGTGSGAIALSIAHERPDARMVATESSADALRWARLNRDELDLKVEIVECDLLSGLPEELAGTVDVVVSNPPYVATIERSSLPPDVVEHEPHEALFAGERGLSIIERLVDEAPPWLAAAGWIVLEIAPHQAPDAQRLLEASGFQEVSITPDLTGRARVAEGHR